MNSEQKYYLGETELKVGQVWQAPGGQKLEGQIIGFHSDGTAIMEIVYAIRSVYDLGEVVRFSNPTWKLKPETKKVHYRVFKSLTTGEVTTLAGRHMELAEEHTESWEAISPRMEYEYV